MSAHGLPQLSANAEYLTIRDCFELGHVGKVLLGEKSSVHVSVEQYKYFVWLDSSAKGPLLPSNTLQGDHAPAWHTLLTSRITATTKLVGANIVCEPIREDLMPHVEATVMATDTVGLQVLQKAKCFDCYATWHEAKMKGELAASAAVLDAGYNLDCFNPPNQGVNWRDKSAWPCAKTVRQHPQQAANSALASHVEQFRSQGGEGFEAQQSEEYDEATEEAAQLEEGIQTAQRVSDSLLEAGFVKPLQHEDPNADQEQTARIGGRLVESGFGRLQFEDAMEHSRKNAQEGIMDADSNEAAEEIFADDGFRQMNSADRQIAAESAESLDHTHADQTHAAGDAPSDIAQAKRSAEDAHTAALTHAARSHMTELKDEITSANSKTTGFGDGKPTVHAGRTSAAEADRSMDSEHFSKAHVSESEEGSFSKICAGLESEPAPRPGSHFEIAATGLAGEVAELDQAQGVDIAFYGDSITELWKYGLPETGGRSNVFWDNFGAYTSAILAVAGDQTSNLWWRMLHGETFEQHPPQMSVVLVGINDLVIAASCGASFVADAADGIAQRILSMVLHLQHANPDSTVLMVGILPCAAETSPGPEGLFAWPNGLTAGISRVNAALEDFASQHHLVHYVDCTDEMLLQGQISDSVLPDGLHPNAEGMARLASCLSPTILRYVKPR
ncbi:hypothetical protein WJX77_002931 [Trebouxia sp. C0004]